MDIDALKEKLDHANQLYRTGGESPLSDAEYDFLLEQVNDQKFRSKVGYEIEKNKVELAVPMGSLNKIKTQAEVFDWSKSKSIPLDTEICVTPKYDGLSLLVYFIEGKYEGAYTRGDGVLGQDVSEHFTVNPLCDLRLPQDFTGYLIGECIMDEAKFKSKYSEKFKNPRNMVAGLLSRKTLSRELADVCYVAYGVRSSQMNHKLDQVEFCNQYINAQWKYKVLCPLYKLEDLKDKELQKVYDSETRFQCDGLVLEVNDSDLFHQIGKETSSLNPAGARAWKPESDDSLPSIVKEVVWQISKNGAAKPVIRIEPIELSGVTISNVTGINARFIEDSGIDQGATVTVIRSGDVIPKIIAVPNAVEKLELPNECPSCQSDLVWNDNRVDIICRNKSCPAMKKAALIDFFALLKADEVGEGIITSLWEAGYQSVKELLELNMEDLLKLEGFKQRKAKKVLDSIKASVLDVPLPRLQHASNLFRGLGEKKLELLQKYDKVGLKPSFDDLLEVDGYSEISAKSYLDSIDAYWEFAAELPGLTYKKVLVNSEGIFAGQTLVFTGFRSPELEEQVKSEGGKIGSSVSKKTAVLVVKVKGSGSSKEKKALDLGVEVWGREDLENHLKPEESTGEQSSAAIEDPIENPADLIQPDLF
jgi:DNA ligase (NAD+)